MPRPATNTPAEVIQPRQAPSIRVVCSVPGCNHTRLRADLPEHHNQILCREHWPLVDHDRRAEHRKANERDPARWLACVEQACERAATGARPAPRVSNKKRTKRGQVPDTWSDGHR